MDGDVELKKLGIELLAKAEEMCGSGAGRYIIGGNRYFILSSRAEVAISLLGRELSGRVLDIDAAGFRTLHGLRVVVAVASPWEPAPDIRLAVIFDEKGEDLVKWLK